MIHDVCLLKQCLLNRIRCQRDQHLALGHFRITGFGLIFLLGRKTSIAIIIVVSLFIMPRKVEKSGKNHTVVAEIVPAISGL